MRNQRKGFISGVLVTLLLVGAIGTAAATVGSEPATLVYSNIRVTLDGKELTLANANGTPIEPFIIGGTTYLPVRGIANAFGLNVTWNGATSTVVLTTPGSDQPVPSQPPAPTGAPTTGQRNALARAKQYLSVMPFSHSGLIKQLEHDGYTTDEATYGADNCGADWNEQAAGKAQKYIEIMSFSRQRLIDQLKHDGFTQSQAEYGVSAVGY